MHYNTFIFHARAVLCLVQEIPNVIASHFQPEIRLSSDGLVWGYVPALGSQMQSNVFNLAVSVWQKCAGLRRVLD